MNDKPGFYKRMKFWKTLVRLELGSAHIVRQVEHQYRIGLWDTFRKINLL